MFLHMHGYQNDYDLSHPVPVTVRFNEHPGRCNAGTSPILVLYITTRPTDICQYTIQEIKP